MHMMRNKQFQREFGRQKHKILVIGRVDHHIYSFSQM